MGNCKCKSTRKKKEIILECITRKDNPGLITKKVSQKLYNSIARIEFEIEDKNKKKKTIISTSFFMKINIKENQYNFLITCYHSIKKEYIDANININVFYEKDEEEEKITIELNSNKRLIKCYESLDTTLIQIIKKDNIPEDKYLFPDLNYKNGYNQYKNIKIFSAGYPDDDELKGEICTSAGSISKINKTEFEHNCDTKTGSSGSPLINNNKHVIGIHYGCDPNERVNYGHFIGAIIDQLNVDKIEKKFEIEINEDKKSEGKHFEEKDKEKVKEDSKREDNIEKVEKEKSIKENDHLKKADIIEDKKEPKDELKEFLSDPNNHKKIQQILNNSLKNIGIEINSQTLGWLLGNPNFVKLVKNMSSDPNIMKSLFNIPQIKAMKENNPLIEMDPNLVPQIHTPENSEILSKILLEKKEKDNFKKTVMKKKKIKI